MRSWLVWMTAALLVSACRQRPDEAAVVDALPPAPPNDDGGAGDAGPVNGLDFSVAGCPLFDARALQCEGAAPLSVSFVPVASNTFSRFQWTFGDGTSVSADTTPLHVFLRPGLYDVTLRGVGAKGSVSDVVSRVRTAFVKVTANPLGDACDIDEQCDRDAGLRCVCGTGAGCGGAFARGLCLSECGSKCGEGADGGTSNTVCVDLGRAPNVPALPWQQRLCARSCVTDKDCPLGASCRDLPGADGSRPWTRACFVQVAGDIGAPCRSPTAMLDGSLCTSGSCADLGARGRCTQTCAQLTCPNGSVCATINDGRAVCVRACGAAETCDADPLLTCEAPRAGGPLGFVVRDHVGATTYCMPRRCTTDSDCAPAGRCQTDATGGQCVRQGG